MLKTILSELAAKEKNIAQKARFSWIRKKSRTSKYRNSFWKVLATFKLKLHKYIAISKCGSINGWESEDTGSVPNTAINLLFGLGHNASLLSFPQPRTTVLWGEEKTFVHRCLLPSAPWHEPCAAPGRYRSGTAAPWPHRRASPPAPALLRLRHFQRKK